MMSAPTPTSNADLTKTGAASSPADEAGAPPAGVDYQMLVQAIEDYAIFLLDAGGHVASWNVGAAKIKGYAAHEIIGQHFSRFYTEEAKARAWPQYELQQAILTGRFEDEGWRVRKDGSVFWANVVITAIRDKNGQHTGFAKITRDLTSHRRQVEALRQSEERFRLLVDSVKDYAIFMLDPDGNVVSWNEGAARIKGYTHAEIVGQHFSAFYLPEEAAAGKPARELALARQLGHIEDEGWRVRKDGSRFWANVTITAVYDATNRLRGYAKITRDLTERKEREELERSGERIKRFLAILAHELRNPLAPVRNAISIMQLESGASPTLARARDLIDRQISHLTRLVDDLLDVGRITSDKIELRRAHTDLMEVIARAVEAARPFFEARRQSIRTRMPRRSLVVNGDLTRLVQVLQNLLHNASKFSPEGGIVTLTGRTEREMAVLEVTDRGCGIPARALDSIFELFVQEREGQLRPEGGLGIGLTLSKSLIEMHGGTIIASSAGIGKGSTFAITLPLVPTTAEGDQPPQRSASDPHGALRILVVDDNRDSADSLAMLLDLKGNETRVAYEGSQAVDIAGCFVPDLALIDIAMPGLDGCATLAALRSLASLTGLYAVAMTGFGQESDRTRTHEAGFDAHLVKPVDMAMFDDVLARAQERRLKRRQPPI